MQAMRVGTQRNQHQRQKGFTIVELLIVIVVIAILAAITIVAYNGIKTQANFSSMRSDVTSVQKIVEMYGARNGHYPVSTSWRCSSSYPTNYVPNVQDITARLPASPAGGGNGYCYRSTTAGTDYKIIRLYQPSIPTTEWSLVPANMRDPNTSLTDRWGVWSPGGAGL